MRLTTSSCRLGGTISARMKRWQLSGSTVGCAIGLPDFGDGPVWCRKRSRWSTQPSHCLPPTTSMEQRQNSPCHWFLNTLVWGGAHAPGPRQDAPAEEGVPEERRILHNREASLKHLIGHAVIPPLPPVSQYPCRQVRSP